MRSITTLDLQYAHRFYGFKGEAQYLHGHTGVLTIEVEDTIEPGVNMVFPCNEIQKTAWEVLKNFDHALILREDDPLLPAILDVYDKQGIRNGHPNNKMKGPAFKTELATAYPDCRLVVTKETMTVEGMIKIVYDLLKDKLNIAKLTFTSGVNAATAEFPVSKTIDRCPLCGIALKEKGVCAKCGYRHELPKRPAAHILSFTAVPARRISEPLMQADRAQPLRCSPCRHSSHPHQSAAAAFPPAIAAPAPTSRCPLCPTHGTKGSVVSSCRHPPSPPVSLPASPSHLRAHTFVAHASGTPSPRREPPLPAASPQTCLSSLNILFFILPLHPHLRLWRNW